MNKTQAIVPGPGSYLKDEISVMNNTQPKFKFGTEERESIPGMKRIKRTHSPPGPGSYVPRGIMGREGIKTSFGMKIELPT
jgi:hypothetical protein